MPPSLTAKSNLDSAMCVLFSYIKVNFPKNEPTKNSNIEDKKRPEFKENDHEGIPLRFKTTANSKQFYRDLLKCFELQILPAHGTGHVQFSLFYLLSTNPDFIDQYLKWLWSKFTSPNTPQILRQAAIAYIASFIARARCINRAILMSWLKKVHERNM